MMAAYLDGVPVWLYDLKDKKRFGGDVTLFRLGFLMGVYSKFLVTHQKI